MTAATLTRCRHGLLPARPDHLTCGLCSGTWRAVPPVSEWDGWAGLDADRIGSPPVLRSPHFTTAVPDPDQEADHGL